MELSREPNERHKAVLLTLIQAVRRFMGGIVVLRGTDGYWVSLWLITIGRC
jgi:hypothetical protein